MTAALALDQYLWRSPWRACRHSNCCVLAHRAGARIILRLAARTRLARLAAHHAPASPIIDQQHIASLSIASPVAAGCLALRRHRG